MAPNHRPDETTPDPESGPAAAPERTAPTPAAPASGPERTSAPASASSAASTPVPALEADLCLSRGAFTLEASLTVRPGEILALLGPNGAGKSSALRALAGLVPLTGGRVLVDGRDQTRTPVEHRPIGMVFQDYLLFPHMSALDNVAFGPRHQGLSRAGARERAAELLAHMDLSAYARVRPRRLSGGQAQRVALARALAVRPRLLLLDEPMAALDASTRIDVRARLGHLLEEFDGATVLVTHDPLDAMVLADRVAVIEGAGSSSRASPPRWRGAPAPPTSRGWWGSTSSGARPRAPPSPWTATVPAGPSGWRRTRRTGDRPWWPSRRAPWPCTRTVRTAVRATCGG